MDFAPEFESGPPSDPRMPTCVNAFDDIVRGGLPVGSVVLLLGESGSGHTEFAFTSAARLSLVANEEEMRNKYMYEGFGHHIVFPEKTLYISFSRSQEDVLRGFRLSFATQYYEAFKKNLVFKDLSSTFFRRTTVPSSWLERKPFFSSPQGNGESLLESLVEMLDQEADSSVVIIDSLTDMFHSSSVDPAEIGYLLKGLQRASKKWNSIVYLLLTSGIIDDKYEKLVSDICDGVLVFGWSRAERGSFIRRYMYVSKFTGVLPHLDSQRISRFITDVKANHGFVVANTERI